MEKLNALYESVKKHLEEYQADKHAAAACIDAAEKAVQEDEKLMAETAVKADKKGFEQHRSDRDFHAQQLKSARSIAEGQLYTNKEIIDLGNEVMRVSKEAASPHMLRLYELWQEMRKEYAALKEIERISTRIPYIIHGETKKMHAGFDGWRIPPCFRPVLEAREAYPQSPVFHFHVYMQKHYADHEQQA